MSDLPGDGRPVADELAAGPREQDGDPPRPTAASAPAFFTVAAGLAAGMTKHALSDPMLATSVRGIRCREATTTWARERAVLAAVPQGSALSHVSAAAVHGLPLPPQLLADTQVHVMVAERNRRPRRHGVVTHRGLPRRRVVRADGIPVTVMSDTWADLADLLDDDELIAVGDAIAARGGLTALHDVVAQRSARHARHVRRLQRVLPRIRTGSRSRMETLARLAFEAAGLPEPELNADIHDEHGQWLANVDFCWPDARLIVEYQSAAHHRTPGQRAADEERRRLLEAQGYQVVFITASMIQNPGKRHHLMNDLAARLV